MGRPKGSKNKPSAGKVKVQAAKRGPQRKLATPATKVKQAAGPKKTRTKRKASGVSGAGLSIQNVDTRVLDLLELSRCQLAALRTIQELHEAGAMDALGHYVDVSCKNDVEPTALVYITTFPNTCRVLGWDKDTVNSRIDKLMGAEEVVTPAGLGQADLVGATDSPLNAVEEPAQHTSNELNVL